MTPVAPAHARWDLIREERIRCGFATVQACAAAAHIGPKRLEGLEGGSLKDPSAVELAKLALVGFDLNYILTGVRRVAPDEQALLENYRAADPSSQKTLRRVGLALAKSIDVSLDGSEEAAR